jgi:hypothetical protein
MLTTFDTDLDPSIFNRVRWDLQMQERADKVAAAADVPWSYVRDLLKGHYGEGSRITLWIEPEDMTEVEVTMTILGSCDDGVWGEVQTSHRTARDILRHAQMGVGIDNEAILSMIAPTHANAVKLTGADDKIVLTVASMAIPEGDEGVENTDELLTEELRLHADES